jgi:hypothetical protein
LKLRLSLEERMLGLPWLFSQEGMAFSHMKTLLEIEKILKVTEKELLAAGLTEGHIKHGIPFDREKIKGFDDEKEFEVERDSLRSLKEIFSGGRWSGKQKAPYQMAAKVTAALDKGD